MTNELDGRARRARGPGAFRAGTVLVVVLLSALGFAAAVLLSGWADELRPEDRSGVHALSNSATGYGGLLRLLQETGVETELIRSSRWETRGEEVRIYTLPRPPSESLLDMAAETRWQLADGGPVLFVLPKWRTRPIKDTPKRGWVERSPFGDTYSTYGMSGDLSRYGGGSPAILREGGIETYEVETPGSGVDTAMRTTRREVKIENLQYLAPGWTDVRDYDGENGLEELIEDEPATAENDDASDDTGEDAPEEETRNNRGLLIGPDVLIDGHPVMFSVHDEDGTLIYHMLTDPDLLNTQGIATESRARLAVGIVEHMRGVGAYDGYEPPVAFDLVMHGYARSSNIIKTMTRPPLLAATLCALAAVLLTGWMAFARFGDPLRRGDVSHAGMGKRALVENAARLMRLAQRTLGLADDYAALRRRDLLRRLRVDGERAERVDAALAGYSKQIGADVQAGFSRVEGASDTGELVRAARELHDMTAPDASATLTPIPTPKPTMAAR